MSIRLTQFTDAEAATQLGDAWTRVEAGVFERHDDERELRIAVGRAGLAADITRLKAELDTLELELDGRPASAHEEGALLALQRRIADLEALAPETNVLALQTSNCLGDEFYVDYAFSPGLYDAWGSSSAGRGLGFSPPVPSQSYAYARVFSYGWPYCVPGVDCGEENYGDSSTPAYADAWTARFPGCSLYLYSWVSPACPGAFLSLSEIGDCNDF